MMMWWGNAGWGWWGWLAMSLSMIAFWGLVIWGIVAVVRGLGPRSTQTGSSPEDILRERLARGEIDEDEYRRRLQALRG